MCWSVSTGWNCAREPARGAGDGIVRIFMMAQQRATCWLAVLRHTADAPKRLSALFFLACAVLHALFGYTIPY